MELKKIQLKDLENFVNSSAFSALTTVPITPERALSYKHNPHAQPDDVVLYLAFVKDQMIAFRSLFADSLVFQKKTIRFAWCSGNWVHPEFRRKGYSEKLLTEAYADWDQKLMFTNYAPNSENLYLKTGWFKAFHQFEGVRAYLYPKTKKLIPYSQKNSLVKLFFSITDILTALFSSFKLLFYSQKINNQIRFERLEKPDKQCYTFLEKYASGTSFNRKRKELEWIFQYPWISHTHPEFQERYPFSSFSKSFKYYTIKIFKENNFEGFFIFSVKKGHLKTLFFQTNPNLENTIVDFLKGFSSQNKIVILTIYNFSIANQLLRKKFPFLHTRKYGQKIYSSLNINNAQDLHFQDGDGDVMFT